MTSDGKWKLAPCPFCGGNDLAVYDNAIMCRNVDCGASAPDLGHCVGEECRAMAVEAWNRRAASPQPPAPGAEVVAANQSDIIGKINNGEMLCRNSTLTACSSKLQNSAEFVSAEGRSNTPSYAPDLAGSKSGATLPLAAAASLEKATRAPHPYSSTTRSSSSEPSSNGCGPSESKQPDATPPTAEEIARRAREEALAEFVALAEAEKQRCRARGAQAEREGNRAKEDLWLVCGDTAGVIADLARALAKPPGETGAGRL